MKKAEKENKKLLDTSVVNHRKEISQKMKELRSNNCKKILENIKFRLP